MSRAPLRSASIGVLPLLVFAACGASRPGPLPPARLVATAVATADDACARCHAPEAAEWSASFHRVAFTDGTFQRSLALEAPKERPFCVRCHAPEGEARGAEGAGCVACHGAVPKSAEPHPNAPHPLMVDPSFAGDAACASCHEFTFDDGRPDLVQETLDEHRASDFASVPCAGCHMRHVGERGGHLDHTFAGGHEPARIAGAVRASIGRDGDGVRISIQVATGHAFPTGDMFRRARLLVFGDDREGHVAFSEERTFGRTWGTVPFGPHFGARVETSDTRIRGGWGERFPIADPYVVRVRYELLFERILAQRGAQVTLESSDRVAEGSVDLER